jgi:hypothetical protein
MAALTVAELFVATGLVDTVNVVVVAPLGTDTVAGTETALGLEEDSETDNPAVGAGESMVSVPVAVTPPITDVGAILNPVRAEASTVKDPVTGVVVPTPADTATVVFAATGDVVAVKVAVSAPFRTVTVGGTDTAAEGLLRVTARSAFGVELRVTVPVEDTEPFTEAGLKVRDFAVWAIETAQAARTREVVARRFNEEWANFNRRLRMPASLSPP